MQTFKSVFGIIGALVPILYCAGLLYYFLGVTGSVGEAEAMGLGPTLLGLAVVGLLFCIPLILKIVRLIIGAGARASVARAGQGSSTPEGAEFDADAALARYLARKSAEATSEDSPPTPAAHEGGAQPARSTFGRRGT